MKYVVTKNGLGDKLVLPFDDQSRPYCPICGTDMNGYPAYTDDGYPCEEICPGCGIQFGDDDLPPRGFQGNTEDYFNQVRLQWLDDEGWQEEQVEQLRRVLNIDAHSLKASDDQ